MDIIIKSFNRPCYLDRCLCSIRQHVHGIGAIRVLDDGTPDKYLKEIQRRHPYIEIVRSEQHAVKSCYLEHYRPRQTLPPKEMGIIPWDMWRSSVRAASQQFLLIEDDQWCVKDTDLQTIESVMVSHRCALVRLFKSPAFDRGASSILSSGIRKTVPWYLKSRLHTTFYAAYMKNQCKLASILHRLGIAGSSWAIEAYAVYVVCGIFDRDFWLEVTGNAGRVINEREQLINALEWAVRHPSASFARTESTHVATTFRSSASSSALDNAVGFDMTMFNKLVNEHWLAGRMDPLAGMPGDFPADVFLAVLNKSGEPSCAPENWSRWCSQFSESFRNLGCDVE